MGLRAAAYATYSVASSAIASIGGLLLDLFGLGSGPLVSRGLFGLRSMISGLLGG